MKKLFIIFFCVLLVMACNINPDVNIPINNTTSVEQSVIIKGSYSDNSTSVTIPANTNTVVVFPQGFIVSLTTEKNYKYYLSSNDGSYVIKDAVQPSIQILNTLNTSISINGNTINSNSTVRLYYWRDEMTEWTVDNSYIENGFNYILDGTTKVFYKIDSSTSGQLVISSL